MQSEAFGVLQLDAAFVLECAGDFRAHSESVDEAEFDDEEEDENKDDPDQPW